MDYTSVVSWGDGHLVYAPSGSISGRQVDGEGHQESGIASLEIGGVDSSHSALYRGGGN